MSDATGPAHVTLPLPEVAAVDPVRLDADGASALLERAAQAEREDQRAVARNLFEHTLRYHIAVLTGAQISSALVSIGRSYLRDGDGGAAMDCLEAGIAVAAAYGDDSSLGAALNMKAVMLWQTGKLDEAEKLYLAAQDCGQRAGDRRLVAMAAQNRGIIATIRGEFSRALVHYEESLVAFRHQGLLREACHVLNNIGMVHTDMHRWADAERIFGEAIALATEAADTLTRVLIDVNVAELAIARADFDRARRVCEVSLRLARALGDQRVEAELRKHLGVVARETGHYQQAEQHFASAETLATMRSDLLLQAELARERAELLTRQGRFRETVQNLNRAHSLFSDLRASHELADVDRRTLRVESTFLDVVGQWGESIESKDAYTQGHCLRVADLACAIAARLGLSDRRLFWFRVGALLHDVGKIAVPPEVLNKPGRLTSEEWALMRSHPEAGVELLHGIDFPEDVIPIILHHHEKWDGSGYPHGLVGASIPLAARVLGLADVYDALTTDRSYKPGMSHGVALATMRQSVGTHFDPDLFLEFELVVTARQVAAAA